MRCLKAEFCFACRKDEYTIDCPALGTLKRLALRRNDKVHLDDWYLLKVVVQELKSNRVFSFWCNSKFEDTNIKEFNYNEGIFITVSSVSFLQGVSIALLCKLCTSHRRDVRPAIESN